MIDILEACATGDIEALERLLDSEDSGQVYVGGLNGLPVHSQRDGDGETPLFYAVRNDQLEAAKLLVAYGTSVNDRAHNKATALHYANSEEMVTFLVCEGANVNAANEFGNKPLHFINNTACARILLDNGARVDARNRDGETPLIYAAGRIPVDHATLLIERGAPIDAHSKGRDTALHRATIYGNTDAVKTLLDYGARMDIQNSQGFTARDYAAGNGGYVGWQRMDNDGCKELFDAAVAERTKNALLTGLTWKPSDVREGSCQNSEHDRHDRHDRRRAL